MIDNYTLEFLNAAFRAGNPLAPLTLLFLFLARVYPIIALTPFLGARVAPHPVKACLGIALFVIFLPMFVESNTVPLTYNMYSVMLFVKEVFIGLLIGTLISIPFTIVQNAGIIIDHQRGGASLMVNDPTVQNQSSPLGTLFNMVMIYIFFVGYKGQNGVSLFFNAIMHSYEIIPPDKFFNDLFFHENTPFYDMMVQLFNKIMIMSIELATPGLLMILMTDFFLGIINRLAPQVQISFLGMPLKSWLALAVICFGWNVFAENCGKQSIEWVRYIDNTLNFFAIGKGAAATAPPVITPP